MSETELIVLCDENGQATGVAEKLASHHQNTPLHRAFSCYVFNGKGELLITQRAFSKKVWPTVWTNSFCGHPAPGESDADAIKRRMAYELGMESQEPQLIVSNYRYTTPAYNGVIENEYCPIYAVRTLVTPHPNPDEVNDYQWVSWHEYAHLLKAKADEFSWWSKDQYQHLQDNSRLLGFTEPTKALESASS